jgi:hypothetical protein
MKEIPTYTYLLPQYPQNLRYTINPDALQQMNGKEIVDCIQNEYYSAIKRMISYHFSKMDETGDIVLS